MLLSVRDERLDELVAESGLTLAEFAQEAGVSRSWLIRVKKGQDSASLDVAERLSGIVGEPVADLFQFTDEARIREAGLLA